MGPINPERSVAAMTALTYCLPPPHTLRPLPATPSKSTGQEAEQGSPSRLLFIEEYHFATAKLVPNGLPKQCLLRLESIFMRPLTDLLTRGVLFDDVHDLAGYSSLRTTRREYPDGRITA